MGLLPLTILAPEALQQTRLSICSKCEFYSEEFCRCKKCGCFLKAKTKLNASKCPLGKW